MHALRVGIIGGAGWLGGAIADAMLSAGVVQPGDLSLSYRRDRPGSFPASFWTHDSQALADRSDVIVLSVRPAEWQGLKVNAVQKIGEYGRRLLISVRAGFAASRPAAQAAKQRER